MTRYYVDADGRFWYSRQPGIVTRVEATQGRTVAFERTHTLDYATHAFGLLVLDTPTVEVAL